MHQKRGGVDFCSTLFFNGRILAAYMIFGVRRVWSTSGHIAWKGLWRGIGVFGRDGGGCTIRSHMVVEEAQQAQQALKLIS